MVDPGYIKQAVDAEEKNLVVTELAEMGKLTPRDYCVTCRVFQF
jgi:hypothetical protein